MPSKQMKAVLIHSYGDPDVLIYEDTVRPQIQPDDVLIRVHAASVNRIDAVVRAGYVTGWFKHSLPLILGWDVSGTIKEVGSDVPRFEVGDAVFARTDINRNGTYAEYVAVRASEVAYKPQSLQHTHAAAVPHAALTAWQALFDAAHLAAGQTVLIHGAAGGVGHFAVQLAKWKGAHVIATASGRNIDFLHQLGVHHAIDYTATKFEEEVRDADVVLDTIGGDTQSRSWATLKRGSTLVSIVQPPSEDMANAHGVRHQLVASQPNAAELTEIAQLIDAGQIKPVVSTILPLQAAKQAHILISSERTRGKIVLQVVDT